MRFGIRVRRAYLRAHALRWLVHWGGTTPLCAALEDPLRPAGVTNRSDPPAYVLGMSAACVTFMVYFFRSRLIALAPTVNTTEHRQEGASMVSPDVLLSSPRMTGARIKRMEDPKLITGGGTYVDDLKFVGLLHM